MRGFYSYLDLISDGVSNFSWLCFAIIQHTVVDGGRVIGGDAIIVYGAGVLAFIVMLLIKLIGDEPVSQKVCHFSFWITVLVMGGSLSVAIYGRASPDSTTGQAISILAAIFQVLSQCLPCYDVFRLFYPPKQSGTSDQDQEKYKNMKKVMLWTSAVDFILSMYWAMYCFMTFDFTAYGVATIICSVLSFVTFYLYTVWVLRPPENRRKHST